MDEIKVQLGGRAVSLLRAADTMAEAIEFRQLVDFGGIRLEADTQLAKSAQQYREANGYHDRLVASEAMADEVEALMRLGVAAYYYVDARSEAGDALLDYRDPSSRCCQRCSRPEAHFHVEGTQICTKCFIKVLPA